jgi:hypothetical protein
MSPREPRPPHERTGAQRRLDGLRPLLQGHLKKQRKQGAPTDQAPAEATTAADAPATESAPETTPSAKPTPPEAKGKRTRGKVETATLPHLEGPEQGPM